MEGESKFEDHSACSLLTSLRSFGIKAIWGLVQTDVRPWLRNAKMSSPSSGYDDERRADVFECHTHHVYTRWYSHPQIDPNKRVVVSSGLTAAPDGARLLECAPSTFYRRVYIQYLMPKGRRPLSLARNTAPHKSTDPSAHPDRKACAKHRRRLDGVEPWGPTRRAPQVDPESTVCTASRGRNGRREPCRMKAQPPRRGARASHRLRNR